MEKSPLSLSSEFRAVLDQLEHTRDNLFITGRAGTGKSTLLQLFRNTTKKKVAVLAPTGIAALNVRGQTLHSFFGFPPKMISRKDIHKRRNARLYRNLQMIIIDEISMVRADMLDNIDAFLRINRDINEPFGGVQMIFFGDLFQLPPVVASDYERAYFTNTYESPYFFSAQIIQQGFEFAMIELHTVYRQDERHFIRLLDNIRLNNMDYDDLEDLNQRNLPIPDDKSFFITLTSRNQIANQINQLALRKLDSEPFTFAASVTGEFQSRLFPTDSVLSLKAGAQVMFVKNDPQKRFVNGTIGKIVSLEHDKIVIALMGNDEQIRYIDLEKLEWEIMKYAQDPDNASTIKAKTIGTFKQYPIKLAWAITIHKSQGKTFDRAIIDMGGGAFEYGQTYVALSRCRTLEGIFLKRPIHPKDIMVDGRVSEFYEMKRYYS